MVITLLFVVVPVVIAVAGDAIYTLRKLALGQDD